MFYRSAQTKQIKSIEVLFAELNRKEQNIQKTPAHIEISKVAILKNAMYSKLKKFCVPQKKVLSFGSNRTVEVRPNSSAEPNVQSVTRLEY